MPARAAAGVRRRALVAALVLGAGLLLADASPAGAHATLIGTVPAADAMLDAAPGAVELQFDEPVEVTDGAVQVFGPGGERVDRGTVDTDDGMTLRAPLDAGDTGTYTVAWRVTSEDSHTITGSFVFHNGTQTGAVTLADDDADAASGDGWPSPACWRRPARRSWRCCCPAGPGAVRPGVTAANPPAGHPPTGTRPGRPGPATLPAATIRRPAPRLSATRRAGSPRLSATRRAGSPRPSATRQAGSPRPSATRRPAAASRPSSRPHPRPPSRPAPAPSTPPPRACGRWLRSAR
jgi:methionine-rich copper-binding protein CopC